MAGAVYFCKVGHTFRGALRSQEHISSQVRHFLEGEVRMLWRCSILARSRQISWQAQQLGQKEKEKEEERGGGEKGKEKKRWKEERRKQQQDEEGKI